MRLHISRHLYCNFHLSPQLLNIVCFLARRPCPFLGTYMVTTKTVFQGQTFSYNFSGFKKLTQLLPTSCTNIRQQASPTGDSAPISANRQVPRVTVHQYPPAGKSHGSQCTNICQQASPTGDSAQISDSRRVPRVTVQYTNIRQQASPKGDSAPISASRQVPGVTVHPYPPAGKSHG